MRLNALAPLLNVEDAPRSLAFYVQRLGFEIVRQSEIDGRVQWAALRHGDVTLMLNETDRSDSAARRERPSYGETVFYFYVDSAVELHATLTARGVEAGEVTVELADAGGHRVGIDDLPAILAPGELDHAHPH